MPVFKPFHEFYIPTLQRFAAPLLDLLHVRHTCELVSCSIHKQVHSNFKIAVKQSLPIKLLDHMCFDKVE
jgi:hypothetical protein